MAGAVVYSFFFKGSRLMISLKLWYVDMEDVEICWNLLEPFIFSAVLFG